MRAECAATSALLDPMHWPAARGKPREGRSTLPRTQVPQSQRSKSRTSASHRRPNHARVQRPPRLRSEARRRSCATSASGHLGRASRRGSPLRFAQLAETASRTPPAPRDLEDHLEDDLHRDMQRRATVCWLTLWAYMTLRELMIAMSGVNRGCSPPVRRRGSRVRAKRKTRSSWRTLPTSRAA